MDDDPTVRLRRPPPVAARRPTVGRRAAGLAAIVAAVALVAGGAWWLRPPPHPPAPVSAQRPGLTLATEAQIRADQPTRLTAFRFAPNPDIVVLDFPGLRQQGLMFNRIAAFAEKIGQPHDRVLTDPELARAIGAHGDTVETYYYGHDYSAGTLRRFFALADRDHVPLDAEEQWLRGFAAAQGMLAEGADQAVITLPREGADSLVDASFRRTILHHELSHGEYFTDPAYVAYVRHFWADVMDQPDRATFQRFLLAQDYDPALGDLTINETQAYLMHTPDKRAFSAEALGMAPDHLALLQARFLLGMPPGWLRDCTSVPASAAAAPVAPPQPPPHTERRVRPPIWTAAGRTCGGRQARPGRAGENLRAGDRRAAGAGGFRCRWQAAAARAEAPGDHPHAAAAHRRLRQRLLQRTIQPSGPRAWPAERPHRVTGFDRHAAAVRSGRRMGVRQQHRLGRPGGRGHHRQAAGRGHAGAIFAPLGMSDTAFSMTPAMRARLARMHQREADGSLTALPDFELPQQPEVHMGGHGLYSTVGDYCRFIRMWLNDGAGEAGRVLKPETILAAEKNGLGDKKIRMRPGVIPALSNDAEFFPGLSKSWALSFMVNDEAAPTGRPAGALGWAGLSNVFFWIDRRNGIGGYWATQILPFADAASFTGHMQFETAVYDSLVLRRAA